MGTANDKDNNVGAGASTKVKNPRWVCTPWGATHVELRPATAYCGAALPDNTPTYPDPPDRRKACKRCKALVGLD